MAANPQDALPATGGFTQGGVDMNAVQAKQVALIDQMIMWQLANPGKPWTQCAQVMGVSTLWCRMMASTDAYRARYAKISDKMLTEVGLFGIREKIAAAAEAAVERLHEKVMVSESVEDLVDAADLLLKNHYGTGGAPTQAPTHVTVMQQLILQGRDQMTAPKDIPAPQVLDVIPQKGD